MFEVGKSYRTRGGETAALTERTDDGQYVIGTIPGYFGAWSFRAVDGRINAGPPDSQYDLMPGDVRQKSEEK